MRLSKEKNKTAKQPSLFAGRYRMGKLLGSGGGGKVYLAEDTLQGDRAVALKCVPTHKGDNTDLVPALKQEFATLTALRHPHLAQVYDFGMTEENFFFSSEWVDGVDLLTAATGSNLNTVFQILLQVLRAVDYLHRRGVLHLDLKPANILVTDPERTGELQVKLIDFGIAKWEHRLEPRNDFSGSPPFSAPEVALGQFPSPASDLYSLGVICHQLFAGAFPFPIQDPMKMLQAQLYQEARPVEKLNPALPEGFSDILLKSVARRPARRFSSVGEFLDAINKCLGEGFTLRKRTAPIHILEESNFLFWEEALHSLLAAFSQVPALHRFTLVGKEGMGKTRVLSQVKAALQLAGVFPVYFHGSSEAERFLSGASSPPPFPLFLEVAEPGPAEWRKIERILQLSSSGWVLASRIPVPDPIARDKNFSLNPLAPRALELFFQEEVGGFPILPVAEIEGQTKGNPENLERLLQEMREAAWMRWGPEGWQWTGPEHPDFSNLLGQHQERWEQRRSEVQEILSLFPPGLSRPALEGLLSLEEGCLKEKLEAWKAEGALSEKALGGISLFFTVKNLLPSTAPQTDWDQATAQLERLYDSGQYLRGARLAELLLAREERGEKISERICIFAARHQGALGHAQMALDQLPASVPAEPGLIGLYREIRARSLWQLGRLGEASEAASLSLSGFQEEKNTPGIIRSQILLGLIAKDRGDAVGAQDYFREAIGQASVNKEIYLQGLAQMNLGGMFQDTGRLQEAEAAYGEALSFAANSQHPQLVLNLKHHQINLLYHMGKSREAEEACFELLGLSLKNQFPEKQAAALYYLSLLSGQKGLYQQKLAYLNQALALIENAPASQMHIQCLTHRSYVQWDQKNWVAAQLDAEAALEAAQRRGNPFLLGWPYLLLGRILRDRPKADLPEAKIYLEKAWDTIQRFQHRPLQWELRWDLGILAKKQGEWDQARDHLQRAHADLESFLKEIPEGLRQSYLRDRKLEKIELELKSLAHLNP